MMDLHKFELASSHLTLLPRSLILHDGVEYGLAETPQGQRLVLLSSAGSCVPDEFEGERSEPGGRTLLAGPLSAKNAAALRRNLTWLRPLPLGLRTSAGMGDRLGLATPGHVRAVRATGGRIAPIFAQQSMREMKRTGRSPQQVVEDATWGVFSESWREGMGADADHIKAPEDIDACLAAGFTFFTVDPGEYVENRAQSADGEMLRELVERLPQEVQPRASGLAGRKFDLEHLSLTMDETSLLKAAAKYGGAIAHVAGMYRHLQAAARSQPFEFEVSVDETEQPTSHLEHIYIASELKRLGVHWVSLAPRYVGRFEKGVDYIGDVDAFEADISGHAAIARQFGPYKLSLHSGSDKFRIYDSVMRQTRGLVHLKTAGTSYLEALHTAAALDPAFFRHIYTFAREHYQADRASYQVSAELERAPLPNTVSDWPALLDQFDARVILHVTYGSVLTARRTGGQFQFYDHLMELLRSHAEAYALNLEKHFIRHLKPFTPAK